MLVSRTGYRWRRFAECRVQSPRPEMIAALVAVLAACLRPAAAGLLGAGKGEGSCAAPPFR